MGVAYWGALVQSQLVRRHHHHLEEPLKGIKKITVTHTLNVGLVPRSLPLFYIHVHVAIIMNYFQIMPDW